MFWTLVLAAVAAAACAAGLWVWRNVVNPPLDPVFKSVPHVPASQFIGGFLTGKPVLDIQMQWLRDFGRVFALYGFVPGRWTLWLADAAALKTVLLDTATYPKLDDESLRTPFVDQFFGSNIVSNNGEEWQQVHDAMAPAFHWEMLRSFMGKFAESCDGALVWAERFHEAAAAKNENLQAALRKEREKKQGEAAKEEGFVVDVAPFMQRLTMDVLGKSIFSFDFGTLPADGEEKDLSTLYNRVVAGMFSPLRLVFSFANHPVIPANKALHQDIARFSNLLMEVIEERRRERKEGVRAPDSDPRDLLDKVLDAGLTDKQLTHNLNTLFLAGHDTTSSVLSMILNQLALNPECQKKLRQEVRDVLAGDPHLTYEKQKELVYMTQVIKETLRMYPPVGGLPTRVVAHDTELCGLTLPAGTLVGGGIYQVHHDPEVWGEDAHVWDPERWAKGRKQPTGAWMPFGMGQRICLGNNFSLQEQRAFLCALLQRYEVRPGPVTGSKQQRESGRNFDLGPLLFMQVKDLFLRFVPLE